MNNDMIQAIQYVATYNHLDLQCLDVAQVNLLIEKKVHIQVKMIGDSLRLFLMDDTTWIERSNSLLVFINRGDWINDLMKKITLMVAMYHRAGVCKCGKVMKIYRENDPRNPNYNRFYARCDGHQLRWLTDKE
jgi:hypothetical protein